MAHSIAIYPELDLVWVRYFGNVTGADYKAVVRDYPRHPDYKLGQRIFVDLRDMRTLKLPHMLNIAIQAQIADYAMHTPHEFVEVILAPSTVTRKATFAVLRSWQGLDTPVIRRVVDSMEAAADIFGIDPVTFQRLGQEQRGVPVPP